jgi:hypothetical protein
MSAILPGMSKELRFENGDVEDADAHRLAGAEPKHQPGPTDEDGDGIVWDTEGE